MKKDTHIVCNDVIHQSIIVQILRNFAGHKTRIAIIYDDISKIKVKYSDEYKSFMIILFVPFVEIIRQ